MSYFTTYIIHNHPSLQSADTFCKSWHSKLALSISISSGIYRHVCPSSVMGPVAVASGVSINTPFTYRGNETAAPRPADGTRGETRIQRWCAFKCANNPSNARGIWTVMFKSRVGYRMYVTLKELKEQYLACMFSLDMNANSNGAFLFGMFT